MEELISLFASPLEGMGYRLVRVRFHGTGRRTLQVMAEHVDGTPMTVDDCARISETLSSILEVEDPVSGEYMLEVSSPGLDRPLVAAEDFDRFAGEEIKLRTHDFVEERKRHRGRLEGRPDPETVRLAREDKMVDIPLSGISKARLVPTEKDLRAALKKQQES